VLALAVVRAAAPAAAELPGEWTRLALDVHAADPSWAATAVSLGASGLDHEEAVEQDERGSVGTVS
jgi:hypothetical protein